MSSHARGIDLFDDPPWEPSSETRRTHVRVQIIPLIVCALASSAFVAAANLPWFGFVGTGIPSDHYSALAPELAPPRSGLTGLIPGSQSWGFLLVAWSVLVAGLALGAVIACARNPLSQVRRLNRLLLSVALASLVLISLVVLELTAKVHFGDGPIIGYDWGAIVGLGLAVVSSIGGWFAWATSTYPRLWGHS
jgi:hypothetical protein